MNKLVKKAFTLIELLVVIAIIGILSGLIVVSMGGMTDKATIAKAQVFSNSLRNSLMMNLVAEWRLDEGGTSQWADDVWSNNDAILGDSLSSNGFDPLWSNNCVRGNCLFFDNIDDFLNCGAGSNLNISSGPVTIETWIYPQKTTNYILGNSSNNANYGYYALETQASKPFFGFNSSSGTVGYRGNNNIDLNKWSHLLVMHTFGAGSNTKIYINGIQQTGLWVVNTGNEVPTCTSSCRLEMGHWYGTPASTNDEYHFYGKIDEVRIYNAILSTSQIQEQYYLGLNKMLNSGNISKEEYILRSNNLTAKK